MMIRRMTRRNFLSFAAAAAATPMFEVKPLRGIGFVLQNSSTAQKYFIETMPGGVALFDYNNAGLLDIFLLIPRRPTNPTQPPVQSALSTPPYSLPLHR